MVDVNKYEEYTRNAKKVITFINEHSNGVEYPDNKELWEQIMTSHNDERGWASCFCGSSLCHANSYVSLTDGEFLCLGGKCKDLLDGNWEASVDLGIPFSVFDGNGGLPKDKQDMLIQAFNNKIEFFKIREEKLIFIRDKLNRLIRDFKMDFLKVCFVKLNQYLNDVLMEKQLQAEFNAKLRIQQEKIYEEEAKKQAEIAHMKMMKEIEHEKQILKEKAEKEAQLKRKAEEKEERLLIVKDLMDIKICELYNPKWYDILQKSILSKAYIIRNFNTYHKSDEPVVDEYISHLNKICCYYELFSRCDTMRNNIISDIEKANDTSENKLKVVKWLFTNTQDTHYLSQLKHSLNHKFNMVQARNKYLDSLKKNYVDSSYEQLKQDWKEDKHSDIVKHLQLLIFNGLKDETKIYENKIRDMIINDNDDFVKVDIISHIKRIVKNGFLDDLEAKYDEDEPENDPDVDLNWKPKIVDELE